MSRALHLLVIVLLCAACQTAIEGSSSLTATVAPTTTDVSALMVYPTRDARAIATEEERAVTGVAPTTMPSAPTNAIPSIMMPTPVALAMPTTASTSANMVVIGTSAGGRAITALRLGDGARVVMLVGGIHGGWEANTVTLIDELAAHFQANPDDVLPGISLVLVAAANPDGLPFGRTEQGRFNGNGVDLNRNWGCGWSADAVWRDQAVNPGAAAFSEPETRALAEYIRGLQPAAVVFYHSAANGVFAGECESGAAADSETLTAVLGEAAGYSYGQPFSAYPVTGTAPSWVDGLGIPSVDVELRTSTDSEFEQNLRGVMAVQRWVFGE